MKDCAEQAERFAKQLKAMEREQEQAWRSQTTRFIDWDNHYSPKYSRCYFRAAYLNQSKSKNVPWATNIMFDAFEGRVLSSCTKATDAGYARGFCSVDDQAVRSEGDCAACQRYIDEHMDN